MSVPSNQLLVSGCIYLVLVAVITVVETWLLKEPMQAHERARTTIGVATVLGLSTIVRATTAFEMWLTVLFGFGIAGAATVGMDIYRSIKWQKEEKNIFYKVANRESR